MCYLIRSASKCCIYYSGDNVWSIGSKSAKQYSDLLICVNECKRWVERLIVEHWDIAQLDKPLVHHAQIQPSQYAVYQAISVVHEHIPTVDTHSIKYKLLTANTCTLEDYLFNIDRDYMVCMDGRLVRIKQ